jgi:hypothetical protein
LKKAATFFRLAGDFGEQHALKVSAVGALTP